MSLLRKQGCPSGNKRHPPLQEKIFGLSIFLFAKNLWRGAMKNGDLDSTLTAGEVNRRFTTSPALSKEGFGVDCIYKWRLIAGSLSRILGSAFVCKHKKSLPSQREVWRNCKYNRLSRLFKPESWVRHLGCKHKNELILWLAPRHRLAQASLLKGRFGGIVNITG